MRSARLLVVAVLAVVLALSSAQNAFAAIELYYDDGTAETGVTLGTPGTSLAVRFFLSDFGLSGTYKVRTVRYYIYDIPGASTFTVRVYGSDGSAELCCSPRLDVSPSATGWYDVDLTAYSVVVSGNFYVAIEFRLVMSPVIGEDTTSPHSRSYFGSPGSWTLSTTANYMISAIVDPYTPPSVGGVLMPANTLALVSPWLAVIGLVGCIGVVVVVVKRRRT
jgi:hypothetical protein